MKNNTIHNFFSRKGPMTELHKALFRNSLQRIFLLISIFLFIQSAYSIDRKVLAISPIGNIADTLPAVKVDGAEPGVFYYIFDTPKKTTTWKSLTKMPTFSEGHQMDISIPEISNFFHCGLKIQGFINIPKDGTYKFFLTSADGSALFINDKKIIDNDGRHKDVTKTCSVTLEKGFHPFYIYYFQSKNSPILKLQYTTTDSDTPISLDSLLFTDKSYVTTKFIETYNQKKVEVTASPKFADEKVSVLYEDKVIASSALHKDENHSSTEIVLPENSTGSIEKLKVTLDGEKKYDLSLGYRVIKHKEITPEENLPASKPKTFAITGIGSIARNKEIGAISLGVRDQIIAELTSKYSCYIVSRSRGVNLALEDQINKIQQIDQENKPVLLPAVDYAVSGYFQHTWQGNEIEFILHLLQPESGIESERIVIKVPSIYDAPAAIAEYLAKKCKLSPKHLQLSSSEMPDKKTWAVLPFSRIDAIKNKDRMLKDEPLSLSAELYLQQQLKNGKLVERSRINEILDELKITSMLSSSAQMAGGIARIAGADRIVIGTVTPYRKNLLRLDISLVDAKSAIVLNTASATADASQLNNAVDTLMDHLFKYVYPTPGLSPSSKTAMEKEGKFYFHLVKTRDTDWIGENEFYARWNVMLLESAYYLLKDDPSDTLFIGWEMLDSVDHCDYVSQEYKRAVLKMAYRIIDSTQKDSKNIFYLVVLAKIKVELEEYDDAIIMLREVLNSNNYRSSTTVNTYIACLEKMERYEEAVDFLRTLPDDHPSKKYHIYDIYKHLNRPEEELKLWKSSNPLSRSYLNRGPGLVRYIELTRQIEGGQAAMDIISQADVSYKSRVDFRYEYAYANALIGNKHLAERIFSNILEIPDARFSFWRTRYHFFQEFPKEYKAKIKNTMKKLNLQVYHEKWKFPYEVKSVPENCKIYLVLIGDVSPVEIKNIQNTFKETFHTELILSKTVIPLSAIPENIYSSHYKSYDYAKLYNWLAEHVKLPDNALIAAFLTREKVDDLTDSYDYTSSFILRSIYRKADKRKYSITKRIFRTLLHNNKSCYFYPCLGLYYGWGFPTGKICEDCQEEYKNYNFQTSLKKIVEERKKMLKQPFITIPEVE